MATDSTGKPVAPTPLRIVDGAAAMDEAGRLFASLPIRYVDGPASVDELGTPVEALQAEIVSDLIVTTADGRVVGAIPARLVEGLVTTDEAGRPTSVVPVWNIGEPVVPTLRDLTLSATTFALGSPSSGTINGATAGSTITASGLPSGLTIDGAARTWAWSGTGSASTGSLTLTETLEGATGSPRDSVIGWTIADTTAPTLTSPTGTATGAETADLSVSTNEANGTLYWYVSASATPPSATDLKAGTGAVDAGNQAVTATGSQSASADGLTAETSYYVHFLHRDAAGNDSAIVTSAGFVTDSAAPTLVTPVGLASTGANPVVGEVLIPTPAVWSEEPTERSYAWYRGATLIGSAGTYTVAEADAADATRDVITVKETVSFASSPDNDSTSSALALARRTWPTLAYNIGRLTKAGYAGVSFASPTLGCLGAGATAPSSWTTGAATSGTDGHWTRDVAAGITPVPKAAGVSAGLNAGPYVFPVTATFADGLSETITLTITTLADVMTIGNRDGFGAGNSFTDAHVPNATIAGKTLEIATGADFGANPVQLQALKPASGAVLKYADSARPTIPIAWYFGSCENWTINDLIARGDTPSNGGRFYIFVYPAAGTPCKNLTLNRPQALGHYDNALSVSGVRLAEGQNITINDLYAEWVGSGVTQDPGKRVTGLVVNRMKVINFCDNVFIVGSDATAGASDITFNDTVAIGAYRYKTSTVHLDFMQISGDARATQLTVRRFIGIHGNGDAFEQGFHSGVSGTAMTTPGECATLDIDGLIYVGRSNAGMNIGSSYNSTIKHCTFWKTYSGGVATSSTEDDNPVANGPYIRVLNSTVAPVGLGYFAAPNTITKSIVFDNIFADSGSLSAFTITDVSQHNGSRSSPPISTGFAVSNPMTVLDAIDYANLSNDEIVSAVKAALTPVEGGAYDLGGGEWAGALKSDGSWASAA